MAMNRKSINEYLVKRIAAEKVIHRLMQVITRQVHAADTKGVVLWPVEAEGEEYGLEWELVLTKSLFEDFEDDEEEPETPLPLLGVRLFLDEGESMVGIFLRWNSVYHKPAWRELNRMEIFLGGDVRQYKGVIKPGFCLDVETFPLLEMSFHNLATNIVLTAIKIDMILKDDLFDHGELPDDDDIMKNNGLIWCD